jgi:PhoPQ-activated pathogenicity-related protein
MRGLVSLLAAAGLAACASASPLWDYVNAPDDGTFSWFYTGVQYNYTGLTGYLLNVTSQHWEPVPNYSNRPIWTHQVLVVVPDQISNYTVASIYLTGGDNNGGVEPGYKEDALAAVAMANATKSVAATLWQVPAQPIVFSSDPEHAERTEDAAVGFTWKTFMDSGGDGPPEQILYFPMTRSAVKAMDAVTAFVPQVVPAADLQHWFVMGASKRGWITWLTAACDARVVGAAPIVMDLMNFEIGIQHMWQSLGNWTFAFAPYYDLNITNRFGTPIFDKLVQHIDVLNYKENLTMPILVIDATGDEFFQPYDDWVWWDTLKASNNAMNRLMIQNAEHSEATGFIELIIGAEAFAKSIFVGSTRPQLDWTLDLTGNSITATVQKTAGVPYKVTLWHAQSLPSQFANGSVGLPNRKDFRLVRGATPDDPCNYIKVHIFGEACIVPILWTGDTVTPTSETATEQVYTVTMPIPANDLYVGYFLEFEFVGPDSTAYRLTTQMNIQPYKWPYPTCYGDSCHGALV